MFRSYQEINEYFDKYSITKYLGNTKENVHPAFVNPVFIKPMDTELIKRVAENHKHIIVVEEGIKKGGFGESVETFILESGIDADVQVMAIDDRFVEQGNVALLREEIGISYKNIYEKVMELTR
jgi:1-deoxy-D-xylulose-5-phosphate synthase